MYRIEYHKKALKDIEKIKQNRLDKKVKELICVLRDNPYKNPPPYERLLGELKDCCSRRINIQHRLVYKVLEKENIVRILSMWSHYE